MFLESVYDNGYHSKEADQQIDCFPSTDSTHDFSFSDCCSLYDFPALSSDNSLCDVMDKEPSELPDASWWDSSPLSVMSDTSCDEKTPNISLPSGDFHLSSQEPLDSASQCSNSVNLNKLFCLTVEPSLLSNTRNLSSLSCKERFDLALRLMV